MVGRRREINLQLQQIADMVLVALAFLVAYGLRVSVIGRIFPQLPPIPEISNFLWIIYLSVPLVPLLLDRLGFYENPSRSAVASSAGKIVKAFLVLAFVLGLCVIFLRWRTDSRSVLLLTPPILMGFLLVRRHLAARSFRARLEKGGRKSERVLVAGVPSDTAAFIEQLGDEDLLDMELVGEVDFDQPDAIADLVELLHKRSISRVIFVTGHLFFDRVQAGISACEQEGVEAWLPVSFLETAIARPSFDSLARKPVLVFRSAPDASWEMLAKNALDRFGALALIVATSPLWLFAAIGILLKSPGPVLFRQKRSGRHGEPFQMFKFRTMRPDAEGLKSGLAESNEMEGPVFKVADDPRIFSFGRTLRKYSIDELPQLINVIKGEMSLVGPRPLPTYEIEQIQVTAQRRRLSVKPGITCLWQVSGRNKITSFEEWVELDLEYIDTWSFWLDLKILLRTIPAVLFGSGAS